MKETRQLLCVHSTHHIDTPHWHTTAATVVLMVEKDTVAADTLVTVYTANASISTWISTHEVRQLFSTCRVLPEDCCRVYFYSCLPLHVALRRFNWDGLLGHSVSVSVVVLFYRLTLRSLSTHTYIKTFACLVVGTWNQIFFLLANILPSSWNEYHGGRMYCGMMYWRWLHSNVFEEVWRRWWLPIPMKMTRTNDKWEGYTCTCIMYYVLCILILICTHGSRIVVVKNKRGWKVESEKERQARLSQTSTESLRFNLTV